MVVVGGGLAFAAASTLGMASIVAVLGAFSPVVTVFLARVFTREQLRPVQHLGVSLAVSGVALMAC